jgi:drug/metabolite transporter (DMT)-like permease
MLMMSTVPILSTIMASIFLGERVGSSELIGILVTVSGIAWVVTERSTTQVTVEDKHHSSGLLFAFLGALGQAANLVAAKFALGGDFPSISATSIRLLVALITLWLLAAFRGQVRDTFDKWRNRSAFKSMVAGSVVGPFLGIWLSLQAVQMAPVGIAATLMALPPVILIPLGYFLYGDRVGRRGVVGTLVAFCGVALIFLAG